MFESLSLSDLASATGGVRSTPTPAVRKPRAKTPRVMPTLPGEIDFGWSNRMSGGNI
jgi:hypothetical protein